MNNFENFNRPQEAKSTPVEKENKTSRFESFKKAFRKGALFTMTAGAAMGVSGQTNEGSDFSKDIKTKNKIEHPIPAKVTEAFPEDELVQGITRKQFDDIVLDVLAKKLRTTKEKLLRTASVELEILLYEKFGKLSQTKKGYRVDIEEKYFNRDGSINEEYWDSEVEQFVSDLQRKVSKVGAHWQTDSDGNKYIVSQNNTYSSRKNLGGAKQILRTLFE